VSDGVWHAERLGPEGGCHLSHSRTAAIGSTGNGKAAYTIGVDKERIEGTEEGRLKSIGRPQDNLIESKRSVSLVLS
jgi:hypothetical protein